MNEDKGEQKTSVRAMAPVDAKELLEKNLELNKEILKTARYVKKYIIWQQVMSVIKIMIILVPLTLALIYVPAWVGMFMESPGLFLQKIGVQTVLNELMRSTVQSVDVNDIDLNKVDLKNLDLESLRK